MGLVLADIDHFKRVNDTHGHPRGDAVLRSVAAVIQEAAHEKGTPYRYGGEEIAVILPNHSKNEAIAVAERLRLAVESEAHAEVPVTASLGVAVVPDHAVDAVELLKAADKALYDAKNLGRNLVRCTGDAEPARERAREPERRQAPSGSLTDAQQAAIRREYFRTGQAFCPADDAMLDVQESTTMGSPTAELHIWCKSCGLHGVV